MCRLRTVLFLCCFAPLLLRAQSYPQGYFRNPLRIPILLAGNFGECRPGHFHSGLDIKTGGHENEPVYAAADGYVSRIRMEPGGFGHGLYITHPNGYTTLYAHLNDFVPRIQQYVRAQQYAQESWTVDLKFSPEQFPVKKGGQIAWSGNTGGSTAPHLHFEIRDTKTEHPLNGQLFGFDIKDTRPPLPTMIAVYGKATSSYNQDPQLIPLKLRDGVYHPLKSDTVEVTAGSSMIGVEVNDFMDGSDNTLAFYTAEWYLNDVPQGSIVLDDIGYDATRYLHAYADYKTHEQTGRWIQLLTQLPGNRLNSIYHNLGTSRGSFVPNTYDAVPVRILLKDAAGNETTIRFRIKVVDKIDIPPCAELLKVAQGQSKTFSGPAYRFTTDSTLLYDDVCTGATAKDARVAVSQRFAILSANVPAHHYFNLQLRTRGVLPFASRNKIAMMYSDGKDTTGRAASAAENGWYGADVRAFGDYWLVVDTIAPVLKPLGKVTGKGNSIAFQVRDGMTSVKKFRGEIDGHWVLFEQHESIWTYAFDGHCGKGAHTLVVKAADENGNEARASYSFTR